MKRTRLIAFMLIVATLLSIPTFAVPFRASDQISSYTIDISAISDEIKIITYVFGVGNINKIGCEKIDIYKRVGSRWEPVVNLDENDLDMSVNNTYAYMHTHYFESIENVEYMVSVTIFAENDDGRDTRSKTEYVTGR